MSLAKLTVPELRTIAKQRQLVNYSKLRKTELVQLLSVLCGPELHSPELPIEIWYRISLCLDYLTLIVNKAMAGFYNLSWYRAVIKHRFPTIQEQDLQFIQDWKDIYHLSKPYQREKARVFEFECQYGNQSEPSKSSKEQSRKLSVFKRVRDKEAVRGDISIVNTFSFRHRRPMQDVEVYTGYSWMRAEPKRDGNYDLACWTIPEQFHVIINGSSLNYFNAPHLAPLVWVPLYVWKSQLQANITQNDKLGLHTWFRWDKVYTIIFIPKDFPGQMKNVLSDVPQLTYTSNDRDTYLKILNQDKYSTSLFVAKDVPNTLLYYEVLRPLRIIIVG